MQYPRTNLFKAIKDCLVETLACPILLYVSVTQKLKELEILCRYIGSHVIDTENMVNNCKQCSNSTHQPLS